MPEQAPLIPPTLPPRPTQTSALAITSLICGISSFILFFPALVAIVCGHIARHRIKKSNGYLQGRGMALAGLICGYACVLLTIGVVTVVVYQINESDRIRKEKIATDIQHGQQIHDLIFQYEVDHGTFPDTMGKLIEKGYIDSLEPLQPTLGGKWTYFLGLSSKSSPGDMLLHSDDDIVIFIDRSGEEFSVGSYTVEPTYSRMSAYKSTQK